MTRQLVIRYTDTSEPDNQQLLHIDADATSTFARPTYDLRSIEDLRNLVRLDIGGNALVAVDLTPIQHITTLRHLDLSENKVQSIDLEPLIDLKNLETLDLSYNDLTTVDLSPLIGCERLRFVYLHVNKMETVNIAPLAHLKYLESVRISNPTDKAPLPVYASTLHKDPPIFLDTVQALFLEKNLPDWLYCNRNIEEIICHPISYESLVASHGWNSVKTHLESLLKEMTSKKDFIAQKLLLESLGLPELACYDGSIRDIISLFPTEGTYDEGVDQIRNKLISLLHEQLERGGSTLFFDIEKLAVTQGSVLIPLIVSRREKELSELTLYDYNGKVNLMPLWLTGFGFNLLTVLGCSKKADRTSISSTLDDPFTKLGIKIPVKKTTSKRRHDTLRNTLSRPLLDYVLGLVG